MSKKVALITGGTGAIGLATARLLYDNGIEVILSARKEINLEMAIYTLNSENIRVDQYVLDVTSEQHIKDLKTFIMDKYGKLDILINNSALYLDNKVNDIYPSLFSLTKAQLHEMMSTNLYAPFELAKVFLPEMIKNNYGRIVNVSSGMGRFENLNENAPFYRISKTSLNALTCILSSAVKEADICINSVCPGWVRSQMGGPNAVRSPEEGAKGIVWAALLPPGSPSGEFFRDGKPLDFCRMMGDPF